VSTPVDVYAPAPGALLSVRGPRAARAHFAAEYGVARVEGGGAAPDVVAEICFARTLPAGQPRDGHKTVRWSVQLGAPDGQPLRVRLTIAGRPRRFALSMVQGFVVEPLVSVAAARAGLVLLPAAGLVEDGAAVVVLGRSRSGKSSVVARALAAGRDVLGDDQVLVDARGQVRAWPRRLRVYSDLPLTAPSAVTALPVPTQRSLRAMRLAKLASGGAVAPSLPLPFAAFGGAVEPGPLPVRRIVAVERRGTGHDLDVQELDAAAVIALAGTVLGEQRRRIAAVLPSAWSGVLDETADSEQQVLAAALAGVPAEQWTVPATWSAAQAVDRLARALGVTRT
jgi:hypothetical protein